VSTENVEGLHPLEAIVVKAFIGQDRLSEAGILARSPELQPSQLTMALGWLLAKDVLRVAEERQEDFVSLTELGEAYAREKLPALRFLLEIREKGIVPIRELQTRDDMEAEEKSGAIGALKESGTVRIAPGGVLEMADPDKANAFENLQLLIDRLSQAKPVSLKMLSPEENETINAYHRKRGKGKGIFRIDERVERVYATTPLFFQVQGLIGKKEARVEYGQLTPELLKDGSWREKVPRKYNIQLRPARIVVGRKSPYREFLDFVKLELIAIGFKEMRGPLVESEFWNMDALYMPQFHPARDIHDVYFVKGSTYDAGLDEALIAKVSAVHRGKSKLKRSGSSSSEPTSQGWRYPFDAQRTRRLILRSQGTAVSARTLADRPNVPGRYFSIARCFRYDQVDATHAPDFFQVEGIVLGEDVHFRTLLGLLRLFAQEVAKTEEVKFLPAYFPFTEPSVEMHARHKDLGWMELGGAGLFRPEVLHPLEVNVPVIAWGLGLDRMAMVALGVSDIRQLFSGDLELVRQKRIRL